MKPAISIVMPVYNTGTILNKTVESIRNQTFNDFELIIIDDGSKEETAKLCDSFSEQDTRIRVIHKENGGTCAARNLGIDEAKGEYITFCDHDDVYSSTILEEEMRLINRAKKYEMAIVGAIHISDDGKVLKYGKNISLADKYEVENNTARVLKSGILGTVWNILYRKDLIGETRFDENLKKGHEDIIFNIAIYQKTTSLIASSEILYYHYIRKSMSTSAEFHEETIDALKIANDKVYEICNRNVDKLNKYDYIELQGEYVRTYTTYLVHLNKSFLEFKKKLSSLCYIPMDFTLAEFLGHRGKDALCFFCVRHNNAYLLYCLIRINIQLKRKK